MSSRLKSGEGLGVFFSTGILIRFCLKCNFFRPHCQAKDFAIDATFFIFIARPKKLNCLSLAMIRKMTKTVKEWNQKNSGVQVVVVRGAGETLCQGDGYW